MAFLSLVQDQVWYILNLAATSLLTLFTGLLIGKIIGRLVYKIFSSTRFEQLSKVLFFSFSPSQFLSQISTFMIDIAAVILALHVLNLAFIAGFILLLFISISIVVGITLWLKDSVINLVARMYFRLKNRCVFRGMQIKLLSNELEGTVQNTHLTTISIISGKDRYEIPYCKLPFYGKS